MARSCVRKRFDEGDPPSQEEGGVGFSGSLKEESVKSQEFLACSKKYRTAGLG